MKNTGFGHLGVFVNRQGGGRQKRTLFLSKVTLQETQTQMVSCCDYGARWRSRRPNTKACGIVLSLPCSACLCLGNQLFKARRCVNSCRICRLRGAGDTSAGAVICVPCKDAERWLQLLWNPAHWARFCLTFPFPGSQSLLCPCSINGVEQRSLTNQHSYYRTATARASKVCDWRQLSHIILVRAIASC